MAYLGEIRMFGGNFAPRGWDLCEGQLLPISENETLFNLIGTIYGGDGQTTFGLPDLRGRVPVHMGEGTGITQKYPIGSMDGLESVTLTKDQLPAHKHALQASQGPGAVPNAEGHMLGSPPAVTLFRGRQTPDTNLPPQMVGPADGPHPHENRMPFLTITYIICIDSKIIPTPS